MFRYWAMRARRDGAPLQRWQLSMVNHSQGVLMLREERDDLLGRTIKVARLVDDQQGPVFPPLRLAEVLQISDRLVVSGIERDESTRREVAQTWLLELDGTLRLAGYRARQDGAPLQRWRLAMHSAVAGHVVLQEERDDVLGRTIKVARLVDDRQSELFPPLRQAEVLQITAERIVLNGIERGDLVPREVAQTWVLEPARPSASGMSAPPRAG